MNLVGAALLVVEIGAVVLALVAAGQGDALLFWVAVGLLVAGSVGSVVLRRVLTRPE